MHEFTVLMGSRSEEKPAALREALMQMTGVRMLGVVTQWPDFVSAIQYQRPRLVLLERDFWRTSSARRLVSIPTVGPQTRIMMFCEQVDVSVVGEAIAHGVHGCLAATATARQWLNAIEVVLHEDVAMPRKLLALALENALHRRESDWSTVVPAPAEHSEPLTDRERDVIRCVTTGMTNKEIALHLGISGSTVKTHLHHVFGKLKVGRRMLLMPRSDVTQ